ncbi:hypothetical protein [Oenococcus oeni]|uniref:hypothetical protein n=1 Tax=Oenococcus oeni TaxID=1247 RepID=UPI0008F9028E|nr:hypothetical protein [Oenococcus oeni]MDV7687464.1 hypothetical protein [Oenococcus oeni]OIM26022.1 hypothetical protein ATX61_06600 [Oenococcus oeni]SYW07668.1 conserved hypothetical protein [Oenococcus oeni]SYW14120.1 conserved hypothetical protein [Oenococcus oeni]
MNEDKIPETIQDIKERAALMKSRGFSIGEEQIMSQAIKDGLQAIVNDLMDGEYFTVQLINPKTFMILGVNGRTEGKIIARGESFNSDFKESSDRLWNYFWDQAEKIVGR